MIICNFEMIEQMTIDQVNASKRWKMSLNIFHINLILNNHMGASNWIKSFN